MVELLARFDEEANINWAGRLEEAGAHVVYGVVGHKTHAKMALVVRREENRLRRYVHLSTGNYHPQHRAHLYRFRFLHLQRGDLRRSKRRIHAAHRAGRAGKLNICGNRPSPCTSDAGCDRRETLNARRGKRARIIAKMNALLEPEMIDALYAAAAGGCEDRSDRSRQCAPCARAWRDYRRTSGCAR